MSRAALGEALGLKAVARAGWVRRGLTDVESVAAHSWGVAWLALALAPPHLDRARLLTYAILHDLAEVRVGDITPADAVPPAEKRAREAAACAQLLAPWPALLAAWTDYEAQADDEARFVRQLDRLDMALQARWYAARDGLEPGAFFESAARAIVDRDLLALLTEVRTEPPRSPPDPTENESPTPRRAG
jgi:putative hydrolase of HD superfamily